MATDVVMPQMGESIGGGRIVRWIKKVGDSVERDEPLLEISTDKVDAEIPSPAAGTLVEIRANEGDTVPVHSVVAVIDESSEAVLTKMPPAAAPAPDVHLSPPDRMAAPSVSPARGERPADLPTGAAASASIEEVTRQRSSPLVRRLASEYNIDISQIKGTGIGGRVTREDILAFIGTSAAPTGSRPATPPAATGPAQSAPTEKHLAVAGRVEPMSVMRKRIAEHMIASRRTSAHVHTVFEVDFSQVAKIRHARKAD